jgi:hypothetical protein
VIAWPIARRAATARSARTPGGAEREKPAREARFESPLHGRRCLRRQRNLRGAASVPALLSKPRQRVQAPHRRRAGEKRARAGGENHEQIAEYPAPIDRCTQ